VCKEPRYSYRAGNSAGKIGISFLAGKFTGSALYLSGFFLAQRQMNVGENTAVDVLARPFVQIWDWVDRVGGFPGQMFFLCSVVMIVIGGLTWYSNKR
jgi:hypothetical protein